MAKRCAFCGEPVSEKDWGYIGNQQVYVCDSRECETEARDADRQSYEEAADDARQDDYGRYR